MRNPRRYFAFGMTTKGATGFIVTDGESENGI